MPTAKRAQARKESTLEVAADGLADGGPAFDPVGRSLDLIGDRWTLGLVRHLLGRPPRAAGAPAAAGGGTAPGWRRSPRAGARCTACPISAARSSRSCARSRSG